MNVNLTPLPKKETMSGKAKELILGVVFNADSRGDLRFYPFCGLKVVQINFTEVQGQRARNAVNNLFTADPGGEAMV